MKRFWGMVSSIQNNAFRVSFHKLSILENCRHAGNTVQGAQRHLKTLRFDSSLALLSMFRLCQCLLFFSLVVSRSCAFPFLHSFFPSLRSKDVRPKMKGTTIPLEKRWRKPTLEARDAGSEPLTDPSTALGYYVVYVNFGNQLIDLALDSGSNVM